MEYKNESGQSLSDIVKILESQDKEIKICIVGAGASEGRMAATLAMMMASERFACVQLTSLPQADQDKILSSEKKDPFDTFGDSQAGRLINDIQSQALKLRAYEPEVFIEEKKPYNQTFPRHKKKKYWQK